VLHVLVAMDAFKGCWTAEEVCRRTADLIRTLRPAWTVEVCPMADGGEGVASAMAAALGGELIPVEDVCGPLPDMRVRARFAWIPDRRLAVVEMAQASGLTLLPPERRNPLRTTTFGTGQVLRAALARNPRRILLGLGGSATVDGGTGAARAFGWRFLDDHGRDLPFGGGALVRLQRIVPPAGPESIPPVDALCDVSNPLCGPDGAARVYGPQKGATPEMVEVLEVGLERLRAVILDDIGLDVGDLPGAGAAGGFGAGAGAFFKARLTSGVQTVARAVRLSERLRRADWVVTGEGSFDEQSLFGKVVAGVRDHAAAAGIRVAVLAGRVRLGAERRRRAGFHAATALAPEALSEEAAVGEAERRLPRAVEDLVKQIEKYDLSSEGRPRI